MGDDAAAGGHPLARSGRQRAIRRGADQPPARAAPVGGGDRHVPRARHLRLREVQPLAHVKPGGPGRGCAIVCAGRSCGARTRGRSTCRTGRQDGVEAPAQLGPGGAIPGGVFRNPEATPCGWSPPCPPAGCSSRRPPSRPPGASWATDLWFHPLMVEMAGPIRGLHPHPGGAATGPHPRRHPCGISSASIACSSGGGGRCCSLSAPAVPATRWPTPWPPWPSATSPASRSFLVAFVMGNGTNYAVALLNRYHRPAAQVSPANGGPCAALWRPPAWRRWPRRSATPRRRSRFSRLLPVRADWGGRLPEA